MSDGSKDMSEIIRLCQELERLVGADAPLRVRTLVEMLMIELERQMLTAGAVSDPTASARRP